MNDEEKKEEVMKEDDTKEVALEQEAKEESTATAEVGGSEQKAAEPVHEVLFKKDGGSGNKVYDNTIVKLTKEVKALTVACVMLAVCAISLAYSQFKQSQVITESISSTTQLAENVELLIKKGQIQDQMKMSEEEEGKSVWGNTWLNGLLQSTYDPENWEGFDPDYWQKDGYKDMPGYPYLPHAKNPTSDKVEPETEAAEEEETKTLSEKIAESIVTHGLEAINNVIESEKASEIIDSADISKNVEEE